VQHSEYGKGQSKVETNFATYSEHTTQNFSHIIKDVTRERSIGRGSGITIIANYTPTSGKLKSYTDRFVSFQAETVKTFRHVSKQENNYRYRMVWDFVDNIRNKVLKTRSYLGDGNMRVSG
jgi:hypothetical protein